MSKMALSRWPGKERSLISRRSLRETRGLRRVAGNPIKSSEKWSLSSEVRKEERAVGRPGRPGRPLAVAGRNTPRGGGGGRGKKKTAPLSFPARPIIAVVDRSRDEALVVVPVVLVVGRAGPFSSARRRRRRNSAKRQEKRSVPSRALLFPHTKFALGRPFPLPPPYWSRFRRGRNLPEVDLRPPLRLSRRRRRRRRRQRREEGEVGGGVDGCGARLGETEKVRRARRLPLAFSPICNLLPTINALSDDGGVIRVSRAPRFAFEIRRSHLKN